MSVQALMTRRPEGFELSDIDVLAAKDEELVEISKALSLNLSLDEMKSIQRYFAAKMRRPTDVELQSLGQAWSEHCCYKSSKRFLRDHIFNIHHPDVLLKGDAGVMAFDEEHAYALRIESHNHPSAIEPYGGAATGIGGIVRDVLCMGAQPIALVDPLFFGPIDYMGEVPAGAKHPKYLMGGVVAGIRDYGNRIGIPCVAGGVYFDERYVGNCIVNVGCIGIAKRSDIVKNAVGGVGDVLILVGGRTGRDGIHGVTFASAELTAASEEESRGAVQLGDPIMKEPTIHACLEVNYRKLIHGMKDLGGGGLSCVVGEIALAGGCGAEVDLSKVPLKETGLAPWEIWVSESQERMMLAAPQKSVKAILEVFDLWDVPATVIGKVIKEQIVRLDFQGNRVFEMDLDFLTKGPEYCRQACLVPPPELVQEVMPELPRDLTEPLLKLLSDPNIASKEWVVRLYDHEVRGSTVIKPLQGKLGMRGPGDATVIKPLPDSWRGLAIAVGVNPWFTYLDPYKGGQTSVDEVCRNISAVGGIAHSLTDCLNFGNPEKPERLGEFREAVKGIGDVASGLNLAVPSGNVSFYNETSRGACLPTATVLGCGIVPDIRKCVTTDLKAEGNALYIVGETKREMNGSAFFRRLGGTGGEVPGSDIGALSKGMCYVRDMIDRGVVRSCHDVSDGGLAVCLSEMCIGGDVGANVDLSVMGPMPAAVKLFSESNSRWLVEVEKRREEEWLQKMQAPATRIGAVGGKMLVIEDKDVLVDVEVGVLRKAWSEPLWRLLG
ncbi:MAG: phosphoribosylformylglycinamidine synthase subunit PurL [Methanomassiliicoccales archaeon]|nr:phosphoribosylformylglycinamidine synthase subunit PurL [Methanomassiliicoccales archaeon]